MGLFCSGCCAVGEINEEDCILSSVESRKMQDSRSSAGMKMKPWSSEEEEESDDELHTCIRRRNRADKDSEEWEKLNYDIHALRSAHREVCTRWKKILLQMGYQKEADSLLTVNRQTIRTNWENLDKARDFLCILFSETSLFPRGLSNNERYTLVMDRLVSLDSAEDFVQLAKEKYPRKMDHTL